MVFKQWMETSIFPSEWRKDNFVHIHKKEHTLKDHLESPGNS